MAFALGVGKTFLAGSAAVGTAGAAGVWLGSSSPSQENPITSVSAPKQDEQPKVGKCVIFEISDPATTSNTVISKLEQKGEEDAFLSVAEGTKTDQFIKDVKSACSSRNPSDDKKVYVALKNGSWNYSVSYQKEWTLAGR
ncbi:hypothetical protein HF1_06710 [Mycoplasma haemofelis str. Langford 1]|uniref:Uncharacterized protein n=1 Tax=Mycoplasma haemofelis (strain Langford 1) TaxID=941640 RepID=E8ZHQ8_MYCHL|nr:hypothetical protein [Mycoplasma haemofelis]CBY92679.1 hypothetical protein HF1_06710 [Mycoplasma haemofelis str. Langford 1]